VVDVDLEQFFDRVYYDVPIGKLYSKPVERLERHSVAVTTSLSRVATERLRGGIPVEQKVDYP
jgi:hypothetical protein